MGERFSCWNHLSPDLPFRFRAFLLPLGCTQLPIQQLAKALTDTAVLGGVRDASALAPIFTSFAAANHAQLLLSWPSFALPCDEKEKTPPPTEWALLVALECARSSLPASLTASIHSSLTSLGTLNPNTWLFGHDEQGLDYGVGDLLHALTNQPQGAVSGRAIGKLARLLAEVQAIFEPNIIAPLPVLICRAAHHVALDTRNLKGNPTLSSLGSRAAFAIACAAKPRPDKLPLASLFGHSQVREQIREWVLQWGAEASLSLNEAEAKPLQDFVHLVSEAILTKLNQARLWGLMPSNHPPTAELHRAVDLACAALEFDPEAVSAWEVQRWGDWCSEPRVGRVFPVGLALLALARLKHVDISARIEAMIAQTRQADGWRYYEDFTDIPPDTDDLGLVLRLFATLKHPQIDRSIFQRSFDLLRISLKKDAEFPVWLEVGLDKPISENAPHWLGPRCVAVAAQLALGMIEAQIPDEDLRSRVLEWILQTWEKQKEAAVFHYTWPFARLLLAKLAHALAADSIPSNHAKRFQPLMLKMVEEIRLSRQADGGWGTPLTTACHLAILAMHAVDFDPWPSIVYLASRQGPGGLWPSEPLYRCPGKDGAPMAHGASIITTGICLDALLDVRVRLELDDLRSAAATKDAGQREG